MQRRRSTFLLITNNPDVRMRYESQCPVDFLEGSYLQVLECARDYIHRGHKLLTHPLSGSVKPNENPYKSLLMSKEKGELDLESLSIMEASIATARKFLEARPFRYREALESDYRSVDLSLISSAIEN